MKPFEIALNLYNLKEAPGKSNNPKILDFYKAANAGWVKEDETAWCAAFMAYCLEESGYTSTNKLNARSYLTWGKETKTPKLGDIVVFWRGSKDGWEGHIGFYINENETHIRTLGGNQSDMVNISEYPKSQLLGFREVERKKELDVDKVLNILSQLEEAIKKIK